MSNVTGTVDRARRPRLRAYALTRYAPRPPEETERETPTPRPRGGGQAERTRETLERRVAARERLERDLTTLRDFHDHNAFSTNH